MSGLVVGTWGIAVFILLFPVTNLWLLDLLSAQGYPRTYPALFLFYAMNYIVLAVITAPLLASFSYYSFRVGSRLKIGSMKGAGVTWAWVTFGSLLIVPYVYQEALNMIDGYEAAIAQGLFPDYAFSPLGLSLIQSGIPVLILFATIPLMLVSAELKMKTKLNGFTASWVLALLAALLALPGWLDGLPLLTLSISVMIFGVELRRIKPE